MADNNKRNLHYFEADSMRSLFHQIEGWQIETKKRLLSVSIENDQGRYCCIALTNPTEVMLVDVTGEPVYVNGNALQVRVTNQVDVNLNNVIPLEVEVTNASPIEVEVTNATLDVDVNNQVEVNVGNTSPLEVELAKPGEVIIVDISGEQAYVFDHSLQIIPKQA